MVIGVLDAAWLADLRKRVGANTYNIPMETMTLKAEEGTLRAMIRITNLNSQMPANDTEQINSIYGHLLLSVE